MEINVVKLKSYGTHCKILYVEDDEIIRQQTHDFLSRFFPSITLAEDGQEGLEKFEQDDFDLVISDINMPRMNGIEMIEKILAIKEEQVVLVTSAYNDSENLMALINLNVSQFVLKPFNNKQFLISLYKIVESLVSQKELATQTKLSQAIINMMPIGVLYLEQFKTKMCNQAFLKMVDFETIETLNIEMPVISIMFQQLDHTLSADTNEAFIQAIEKSSEAERIVCIETDKGVKEYQVNTFKVDEGHIVTFDDVTALQESLNEDLHTKLPMRRNILEYIQIQSNMHTRMHYVFVTIHNFENVLHWYGKNDALEVETEAGQLLRRIHDELNTNGFLGYFAQNQFLFVLSQDNAHEPIIDAIKECDFMHNAILADRHLKTDVDFHLSFRVKPLTLLSMNNSHATEISLMNEFESLRL